MNTWYNNAIAIASMFKFLNLNPEIFGMNINDGWIRIVKLKKKRRGFSIASFNEVEVKPGIIKEGLIQDQGALIKAIKEACRTVSGKKLATNYVVVSLPEEKSFSQMVQMPQMTEKELSQAVPFEAENYIPLAIDKVYLDYQVSSLHKSTANHLDVLINVMPKPIIDSYVACFKGAGLIPYILEVESQAIARALVKEKHATSPLIIIDFGQTKTSFIIFSGDSVRFTSSMPVSSQQLTEAISKSFDISTKKAEALKVTHGLSATNGKYNIADAMEPILADLAEQIKKYIRFYHDHSAHESSPVESNIEKIILCGGGANLKGFPDFLSKKLNIPVHLGNAFTNIIVPKKKDQGKIIYTKALSFTTALGLALRGVSEN